MQTDTTIILRSWRGLGKEKRKGIMIQNNISVITYEEIKIIYNENIKA